MSMREEDLTPVRDRAVRNQRDTEASLRAQRQVISDIAAPRREERRVREAGRAGAANRDVIEQILNLDFNERTDWLQMSEATRRAIAADPELLNRVETEIDPAVILDYVYYGTPQSPGIFMTGTSDWFIFDEELDRYVNISFATQDQMAKYSDKAVFRSSSGQFVSGDAARTLPEFKPINESFGAVPGPIREFVDATGDVVAQPFRVVGEMREQNRRVDRGREMTGAQMRELRSVPNEAPELTLEERRQRVYAQLNPVLRWQQARYRVAPLGFTEAEMVQVQPEGVLQSQLNDLFEQNVEASRQQNQVLVAQLNEQIKAKSFELLQARERPNEFGFAETTVLPLSERDQDIVAQRRDWRSLGGGAPTIEERQRMEGRARALQASAYRDYNRYVQPNDPRADFVTEANLKGLIDRMAGTPERTARLKQRLISTGFLFEDDVNSYTVVDAALVGAVRKLATEANLNGLRPEAHLNDLMNDPELRERVRRNAGPGGGGAVTIRLTNPEDIKAVAQAVAVQRLGRRVSDNELDALVQSYQQLERSYQTQAAAGGTAVQAPSLQTAAGQFITQQFEREEDMFQMGQTLDNFRSILRGGR